MATLDSQSAKTLKAQLSACEQTWLLALATEKNCNESINPQGVLGIIDWRLHGRLSQLLRDGEMPAPSYSVHASHGKLGKAALLLYRTKDQPKLEPLMQNLLRLKVRELCLAESTFPEDFLGKLKHTLTKEGIRWVMLESKTT